MVAGAADTPPAFPDGLVEWVAIEEKVVDVPGGNRPLGWRAQYEPTPRVPWPSPAVCLVRGEGWMSFIHAL